MYVSSSFAIFFEKPDASTSTSNRLPLLAAVDFFTSAKWGPATSLTKLNRRSKKRFTQPTSRSKYISAFAWSIETIWGKSIMTGVIVGIALDPSNFVSGIRGALSLSTSPFSVSGSEETPISSINMLNSLKSPCINPKLASRRIISISSAYNPAGSGTLWICLNGNASISSITTVCLL